MNTTIAKSDDGARPEMSLSRHRGKRRNAAVKHWNIWGYISKPSTGLSNCESTGEVVPTRTM
jgi:hypothetical protein